MSRIAYIIWRIASDVLTLVSRAFNAIVLRGSTAQTTSSRAHLDPSLAKLRVVVNFVFFLDDDHCKESWDDEVDRARRTLKLNKSAT